MLSIKNAVRNIIVLSFQSMCSWNNTPSITATDDQTVIGCFISSFTIKNLIIFIIYIITIELIFFHDTEDFRVLFCKNNTYKYQFEVLILASTMNFYLYGPCKSAQCALYKYFHIIVSFTSFYLGHTRVVTGTGNRPARPGPARQRILDRPAAINIFLPSRYNFLSFF